MGIVLSTMKEVFVRYVRPQQAIQNQTPSSPIQNQPPVSSRPTNSTPDGSIFDDIDDESVPSESENNSHEENGLNGGNPCGFPLGSASSNRAHKANGEAAPLPRNTENFFDHDVAAKIDAKIEEGMNFLLQWQFPVIHFVVHWGH